MILVFDIFFLQSGHCAGELIFIQRLMLFFFGKEVNETGFTLYEMQTKKVTMAYGRYVRRLKQRLDL